MKAEAYCASQLKVLEAEHFLAVAEQTPGRKAPDLLSYRRDGNCLSFRIREVKFKLEARLIEKALAQLESGLEQIGEYPAPAIDRLELVVALQGRKIKAPEKCFLGTQLGENRFELLLNGQPCRLRSYVVTVLFL